MVTNANSLNPAEARTMSHRRRAFRLALAGLVLLAVVPLLPSLPGKFLDWDDPYYVTHNFRIHQLSWANAADLFRLAPRNGPIPNGQYTPLAELTLMVEHRLAGLTPWVYRATNVAIHALNVLLVYVLLRKLRADRAWAWLTAALFAVHPLHVESVAWIAERKDVLCAFFYLGAMISYLHFRDTGRRWQYLAALAAGVLALLSKPMAVTLPAVLVLCDLYLRRPLAEQWKRPWLLPFAGLSLVFAGITLRTHTGYGIIRGGEVGNVVQNAMMACWNFFWFAGKTVWPVGLTAYVPVPPAGAATTVLYVLALLGVAALAAGLAVYSWRRGLRLVPFGVFFFMVALLPVSRLVPIGIRYMVADRFFYIPGIGFLMLLACGLVRWVRRPGAARPVRIAAVAALVLAWGGLTFAQSRVWRTSETLWTHVLERVPDATVALNGLALARLNDGQLERSDDYLQRSLQADPDFEETWALRSRLAYRQGDLEAAERYLDVAKTKGLSPLLGADIEAKLKSAAGDHQGAILARSAYVELQPAAPEFYRGMAWDALHLGDESQALACLAKAQELAPAVQVEMERFLSANDPEWARQPERVRLLAAGIAVFPAAYDFAQDMHFRVRNEARALKEYDLILANFEEALACWRRAAAAAGEAGPLTAEALSHFGRMLGIAAYNKGCLLAKSGRTDEALAALRRAFEQDASLRANARTDADLAALRENPDFIELTRSPDAGMRRGESLQAQIISNARTL
ncbi:MAG TPA: phospholipid carrier-dependent glycosyltransferase [Kiritimatiellia bacterium]|nr:phospholipid carrier-dependent glycosyltransferase [Kiritimatiellia bacterium]